MTVEIIECGDALGIADVDELYARLLASLADSKQVTFDCSQIERIDTAALQMLFSFSKESEIHGQPISWGSASEVFVKNARLLGLATLMNIDNKSDG